MSLSMPWLYEGIAKTENKKGRKERKRKRENVGRGR